MDRIRSVIDVAEEYVFTTGTPKVSNARQCLPNVPCSTGRSSAVSPSQSLLRLSIAVSHSLTGIAEDEDESVKRESCRLQFRRGVRTAASATETPRCDGSLQKLQTQGGAWSASKAWRTAESPIGMSLPARIRTPHIASSKNY